MHRHTGFAAFGYMLQIPLTAGNEVRKAAVPVVVSEIIQEIRLQILQDCIAENLLGFRAMRIGRKIAVIQTDEQRHAVAVLARTQIKLVVKLLCRIISVIAVRRVVVNRDDADADAVFLRDRPGLFLERVNLGLRQHLFIVEHARLVCRWVNGIRAAELCGLVSFLRLGGRGVALIRYIVLNRKGRKQQQKHCQERSQTQFSLVFHLRRLLTENTAAPSAPQS